MGLTCAGNAGIADPLPDDLQGVSKLDSLLVGQLSAVVCGGNEAILVRLR
jgi:hypothetical protein